MSLENEDGSSAIEASKAIDESQKKPKISYTRDFLLSLSELEICKKLPSGFDRSVLSEFEDASHGIQDRSRVHGSLLRRNDYSSSPPTRGDSSNISRGVYGRWDNRSSGWSDKDSDSQSDLDSESGKRTFGNQSRRSWQNAEHDGLLGSGSFPRPSGYATGTSAPKSQTNEHYQLKKSSEPYHPPRPFKAVPHTRTSANDSFNDETFGSSECTSQDRAEEERKRRASFELMRKEQQKVHQEKQKLNANKHKRDAFTDLILEETKEKGLSDINSELDSAIISVSNNDSGKPSFSSHSSTSRPLVPPGFKSTVLEKISVAKPVISTEKEQNPKHDIEEIQLLAKGNPAQNGTLDNQGNMQSVHKLDMMEQHPGNKNSRGLDLGAVIMSSSSDSVVSTQKLGMDDPIYRVSGHPELYEAVDGGEVYDVTANKVMGNKIVSTSSQKGATSILAELFGSAPTVTNSGSSSSVQEHNPHESVSHSNAQSSKFAQWFNEDEKIPMDGKPNDLLSLIVGGEKSSSQVPNVTSTVPLDAEHLYNSYRPEAAPPVAAVLTCEDLEQTMLSEYTEKGSNSQPEWTISGQENMNAKAIDNQATHHLLSLLQKGPSTENMIKPSSIDIGSSESKTFEKSKDANAEELCNSGQGLTLETLFGTAFMKELQSAQAPVSAQRGEIGSFSVDETGSNEKDFMSNLMPSKQKSIISDKVESWSQFDGPRVDLNSLEFQSEVAPKSPKQAEIQLPEEESLFTVGDPVNPHNSMFRNTPSDATFDIAEKLAALNSGFRGQRPTAVQENPRLIRGPYDLLEPERQFNNIHAQASMTHNRRPMFHSLDPHSGHINSQMRFPEHDTPPNHQFPANLLRPPFHHPDNRVTGFNVSANPQMQMPGNFPPHLLRDFPRPSPVPPHLSNQTPNFMSETEAMHGFPFGHRQPTIGGRGMPLPAADGSSGSNHPEALQRMMEMELRAQAKQIRPFNGGHSQGMYGHELDMGFRYR